MTLIINHKGPGDPMIAGVVCDRCKAEVRDAIELREVVHVRLHAGYGSAWGDGNLVEVDLCDACGHRLLKRYASIVPTSEVRRGKAVGGLDLDRVAPSVLLSPNVRVGDRAPGAPPDAGARGAWAWVRHQTLRYFIPASVLFRPIVRAILSFGQSIEREELKLRLRFGRD